MSDLPDPKKQNKLNALAGQMEKWETKSKHYAGLEADFLERNPTARTAKQAASVSAGI